MWELPPSTIPWEKTRSPVEPKEVSLGKVSGGMPSPLLSPCRKPQVNGPVPWESLRVPASLRLSERPPAGPWAAQEKRRKGGKLTLLVLFSQHHKPWEQTLNHKTGISSETCQHRWAWLGSQNSTFHESHNLKSLKPFPFNWQCLRLFRVTTVIPGKYDWGSRGCTGKRWLPLTHHPTPTCHSQSWWATLPVAVHVLALLT